MLLNTHSYAQHSEAKKTKMSRFGAEKRLLQGKARRMEMSRECMFLGSLSRHNKDLEQWTLKPSALSGLGQTVLQLLGKSVLQLYFI